MKIKIKDLHFSYDQRKEILKGVNLDIQGSQSVGIIGQNGAGKTTLVKQLNRLLEPTSGSVQIDNELTTNRTVDEWAKTVGYVFQNPNDQIFLDSVKKEFMFGPAKVGIGKKTSLQRLQKISRLVGLNRELDTNPLDLMDCQRKFCTIGSVLMMDPEIVIFDEPTCGQDKKGTERLCKIVDFLLKQGKLCIMISHDMNFVANNCDRVIVMNEGNVLLDGQPADVFNETKRSAKAYITPPAVTRVGQAIGLKKTVFNLSSFIEGFKTLRSSKGGD